MIVKILKYSKLDLAKKELTNPYEFSDADMLKAKELYTVYCGVCHGSKGDGQGI